MCFNYLLIHRFPLNLFLFLTILLLLLLLLKDLHQLASRVSGYKSCLLYIWHVSLSFKLVNWSQGLDQTQAGSLCYNCGWYALPSRGISLIHILSLSLSPSPLSLLVKLAGFDSQCLIEVKNRDVLILSFCFYILAEIILPGDTSLFILFDSYWCHSYRKNK